MSTKKRKEAPPETVNVNIRIIESKRDRFNGKCYRADITASDALRLLIDEVIAGRITFTDRGIART